MGEEDQDEQQDGNIVSKDDDSKRRVPKGPNNAPVDTFCPRRWLVIEEEKKEETREEDEEEKQKPKTKQKKKNRCKVYRSTIENGFRAFGSSARVCPGRDLPEIEI